MTGKPEWNPEEALSFVAEWQERFTGQNMPRDFFPLLHSVAEYLRVSGQARRSAELLRCEATMGVERYLEHRLEHARLLALALFEVGEKEEARRVVEYYAARPYLFDDLGRLGFFLFCRSAQALEEHDAASLAHCIRLMARTQAGTQDACLLRVIHQAGGLRQLFAAAGRLDFTTRFLVSVFWGTQRLAGRGVAAGVIGRGLHFCLNMLRTVSRLRGGNQTWMLQRRASGTAPRSRIQGKRDTRPALVTRAMGGIGDILMMTPGLKALHRKYPDREIHFAVPKAFHALLAHNSDVELKDINDEILHQEDYSAVYNLTECPASRVESATLPNVRRNRIDIFSAAMGVSKKLQDRVGRKPVYLVTEEEKAWARSFFAERGLAPEQCIAVQPYAADSYRDYPHMEALVACLAENQPVLLFHGETLLGFDYPQVLKIDRYPLRLSIALLFLCKMLITVDSAFLHVSAAFDQKTLALFGPIDGAVRTKNYPRCEVVHGYTEARCTACWRNQGILCGKKNMIQSRCLECIYIEKLVKKETFFKGV
jgi:ADP-heptose:LPS heptosyltransferase